ncbi:sensor histidine kinase [Tessaracoccus flavus]|uniref:histidine kinase n=1 Tax=Tessaracoccus flavus TaxID=1610493 RepID=A0A1Q2CBU6_9ACTN|nr:histidine kinase [Tessaracoccus flavus]AQP43579.1 hypothetical protein RPIT_01040 [Tessaracoccus flavus]SDY87675.1 Signal transduction histidine kinase [Tessaracoccus flavus]
MNPGPRPAAASDRIHTHPQRITAALLVGYLLLAGGFAYLSLESSLRTPPAGILVLGTAAIATIVIRHRLPTLAFAAALALLPLTFALGTGAEAVLIVPALFRAGAELIPRRAWGAFSVSAAVGIVAAVVLAFRLRLGPPILGLAPRAAYDEWPTDWISAATVYLVVALITTLIGINVGHRRRHISSLVERAEQMERERDQQASIARALERERIAREMHDVIAHSLAVMIALADGADAATSSSRPDEAHRAIKRVAETGRRTLGEVRLLLGAVRRNQDPGQPSVPTTLGIDDLPALADGFRTAGLPVRLEVSGHLTAHSSLAGLTTYRIVQESLTNVLRHARDVRDVHVQVQLREREAVIVVEDTSAPVSDEIVDGRGLVGIRERAAFYDGDVTAGPRAAGGWRVEVRLPMEEP